MFSNTASFYVFIDILFRFGILCDIKPFLLVLYLDSYKEYNCCSFIAERCVLNISCPVVFTQVFISRDFSAIRYYVSCSYQHFEAS